MKVAIWDEVEGTVSTREVNVIHDDAINHPTELIKNLNILLDDLVYDQEDPDYKNRLKMFDKWKVIAIDGHVIGAGPFSDRDHHSVLAVGPVAEKALTQASADLMSAGRDSQFLVSIVSNWISRLGS